MDRNFNRLGLNIISLNVFSGDPSSKKKIKEWWATYSTSGKGTITIEDVKTGSISALIVSGFSESYIDGDTPIGIRTARGVIRSIDAELPTAYARVLGIRFNADSYYKIDGFRLKGSDTLRFSFEANKACNVIGCYTTADAQDNYDLYVALTSGSKYLRYNGGTYNSYIDTGVRYDVVITPTGATGLKVASTWTKKTFTASVDMTVGTTSVAATSSKLDGVIYGDIVVDNRLQLIPCERIADGVIGYYDTIGKKFYEPAMGVPVSIGYDISKMAIVEGTGKDDITINSEKVAEVAPFLMRIGDYNKDSHDIVTGKVTRKIGYRVLDGTEEIVVSAYSVLYIKGFGSTYNASRALDPICSHYMDKDTGAGILAGCSINSNGDLTLPQADSSATSFKEFCIEEYAKGRPVIVVFLRAQEMTDYIDPQPLRNPKGTISIQRDATVSDLDMQVTCLVKTDPPSDPNPGGGMLPGKGQFRVEGYKDFFRMEEGMTWFEWCASAYNIYGWECNYVNDMVYLYTDGEGWFAASYYLNDPESTIPIGSDKVKEQYVYTLYQEGGIGGGGI